MLTGVRPFQGESAPLLMAAILKDTPRPLREYRTDAPEALDRLICRCLEKRAEDRVQTARDVYNELRHVQKQLESGAARSSPSAEEVDGHEDGCAVAIAERVLRLVRTKYCVSSLRLERSFFTRK